MKRAYELALERLERDAGPTKKLSDQQKAQIAEIDRKYDAKVAEKKLEYESRMAAATPEQADELRKELAETVAKLETERESQKDAIWNSDAS